MIPASEATLLVTGGPIHTHADGPPVEALAIRGERVVAAGAPAVARAALGRVDAELDVGGQAVLPGFVDAHCHPLLLGESLGWVDCRPEPRPDLDSLVTALREAAREQPGETPLRGFGYEQHRLADGRHPSRVDLDAAATDREIYLMHASGHGGVVNSYTLRRHGITAVTPDPAGGHIDRDADGEPTGRLWDAACDLLTGPDGVKITNHGPNFHLPDSPESLDTSLQAAQDAFLAAGVTTVGDAQVSARELAIYLRARDAGRLRTRVTGYLTSALLDHVEALGMASGLGDEQLRLQGVKLYADGTLGGWTAYFPEGYTADPCHQGQLYHSPEQYAELIARAHRMGLQTATHAQSPHAIGLALDAVEKATTDTPRPGIRHRIEHCGLPTDEQIERMARLGVHAVVQPQHHARSGDSALAALGDRAHRYNPCGSLTATGVDLALSSDAPVAPPHPLEAAAAAATRRTHSGTVLGEPALAMPVASGLAAHTRGGAYALHCEDQVGSLAPGMLADFVVLPHHPLKVRVEQLSDLQVSQTWIGGIRVWTSRTP